MNRSEKILIVASDSFLRTSLFRALSKKGYQVITAHSQSEADTLTQIDKPLSLAIIDSNLSDGKSIELMGALRSTNPHLKVVILVEPDSETTTPETLPKGVSHIVDKSLCMEDMIQSIDSVFSTQREVANVDLRTKYEFENIIGHSPEVKNVLTLVERVSKSDSTILITGESGTGKELIAKAVHLNSTRMQAPFVPINCAAIPSELLESELFGHVKGAFTNAIYNRVGRFELAEGGTIFFDEIGDMTPNLQVKLLRVLQEKMFEPIGSTKTIESNIRVIAATNIHLEKAVKEGRFREDLYYRLNVIPINIPPLKERQGDISVLLHHFMEKFNRGRSKKIFGITPEAMNALTQYNWPGNVRELENLIERVTILKGEGLIEISDLPPSYISSVVQSVSVSPVTIPDTGMDFNSAVDAYENSLIMQALERTGWNRNQAAILLKLNRTTLVEKIKKKGLKPPTKESP